MKTTLVFLVIVAVYLGNVAAKPKPNRYVVGMGRIKSITIRIESNPNTYLKSPIELNQSRIRATLKNRVELNLISNPTHA